MKKLLILLSLPSFLFIKNCSKSDVQTILCNATDDADII